MVARLTGASVVGDVFDIYSGERIRVQEKGGGRERTQGMETTGERRGRKGMRMEETRGMGTNACRVRVLSMPTSTSGGRDTRASDEVLVEIQLLVENEHNDHFDQQQSNINHDHHHYHHNNNHNDNNNHNNSYNNNNNLISSPTIFNNKNSHFSRTSGIVSIILTASTTSQVQTLSDRFIRSLHRLRSVYTTILRLHASRPGLAENASRPGLAPRALIVMPGAGVPEMLVQLALDHEITQLTSQRELYPNQMDGHGNKHSSTTKRHLMRLDEVRHFLDVRRTS